MDCRRQPVGRAPRTVRVNPDRDAHPTTKQGSFLLSGDGRLGSNPCSTNRQDRRLGRRHAARRASTKDGASQSRPGNNNHQTYPLVTPPTQQPTPLPTTMACVRPITKRGHLGTAFADETRTLGTICEYQHGNAEIFPIKTNSIY